jgi:hypothetical protein
MPPEQKRIEGTVDVPSAAVENAAKVYTKLRATWQALGTLCDTKQDELGKMMDAENLEKFDCQKVNVTELVAYILSNKMKLPVIGAYDVLYVTTATSTVKVRTQKKEK